MRVCVKDANGNCQHATYDSSGERWIIPSGTHYFMGVTVYAEPFTDYLITSPPGAGAKLKDNPAGELKLIIKGSRDQTNEVDENNLLQGLLIYIAGRDRLVFDHAYGLGRRKVKGP